MIVVGGVRDRDAARWDGGRVRRGGCAGAAGAARAVRAHAEEGVGLAAGLRSGDAMRRHTARHLCTTYQH